MKHVENPLFGWLRRKARKSPARLEAALDGNRIPTVKFDASRVTDAVRAEIRRCVTDINGPTGSQREAIYDAALRSVTAGRDLHALYLALTELGIEDMTRNEASAIASWINNRATSLMDRERQQSVGIEKAQWMYSGGPCLADPSAPTDSEQDKAHKAASGQQFKLNQGMFLNGEWTWPGYNKGCRCSSKPVIPGLE
jgi:hypothetical protein